MMKNSNEWSKPLCGVTHFRQNNVTHTVVIYGDKFCEAYKFSWLSYSCSPTYVFFVGDKKPNSVCENAFYGSSTITSAVDNAKAFLLK